jgi:hypothetical protein
MKKIFAILTSISVVFAGLVSSAPASAEGSANPTFAFTSYQATVGVSFWAQLPPTYNNLNGPTPTWSGGSRAVLNTTDCDALPSGLEFVEDAFVSNPGDGPTYNISGTPATGSEGTYNLCFDTETNEGSGLVSIGTSEVVTLVVGTSVPIDAPTDYTIDCQIPRSAPFDGNGFQLAELDGAQEYTKTVRVKGCAYNTTADAAGRFEVFVGPGTNVVYTIVIPAETYATVTGSNPSWVSPANASFELQINNFAPETPPDPSNFNEENPTCEEDHDFFTVSGEIMQFTGICDLSGVIDDVELIDESQSDGFDEFGFLYGYNPDSDDNTINGDSFAIRATRVVSNENGVLELVAENVFSVASQSRVDVYYTVTMVENSATWSFEVFQTGTSVPAVMDLFIEGGLGSDSGTEWSSTSSSSMYSTDGYSEDPILVWKTDGDFVDIYQGSDNLRSEWMGSSSGSLSVIVAGYECGTSAELDAHAESILDNFETMKNTAIPVFSPEVCPDPSTFELSADYESISEGEAVTFSYDAPDDALAALFVDGEFWGSGPVGVTPNPFPWEAFGDCDVESVMTFRIYDEMSDPDDGRDVSWDEDYAASVSVTLNAGCEAEIEHDLELLADIGDAAEGSEAEYSAVGLEEGSTWTLTLRSTPQVLATGTVPNGGEIGGYVVIPAGLEAGWHSLTLSGTDINGDDFTDVVWFELDSDGIILAISEFEPVVALASTGANDNGLATTLAGSVAALLVGFLLVTARRRKASIDG